MYFVDFLNRLQTIYLDLIEDSYVEYVIMKTKTLINDVGVMLAYLASEAVAKLNDVSLLPHYKLTVG